MDDVADDDGVSSRRTRARAMLDEIARQVRQALVAQAIDMPVFFMIPHSGASLLTFGTVTDPTDSEWARVSEIVAVIVRETVGLDRVCCREVTCARTHDHQHEGAVR